MQSRQSTHTACSSIEKTSAGKGATVPYSRLIIDKSCSLLISVIQLSPPEPMTSSASFVLEEIISSIFSSIVQIGRAHV